MRYLREETFVSANGKPFRITGVKGTEETTEEATISGILHWLLNSYHPQVFQQSGVPILNNAELRSLNRAIGILEGQPQAEGHYAFEDADFVVISRVVSTMAPVLSPRNSPILEDILDSAAKSLLKTVEKNG